MEFKEFIKKYIEEKKEYYEKDFKCWDDRYEAAQSEAIGILEGLEDEIKEFEEKEKNNGI